MEGSPKVYDRYFKPELGLTVSWGLRLNEKREFVLTIFEEGFELLLES